ncbi:LapA family protein [Sinomonas atrocyanea]
MTTDPAEGREVPGRFPRDPGDAEGRPAPVPPTGAPGPAASAPPSPAPPSAAPPSARAREETGTRAEPARQGVSRAGATWTAVIAGLVVFILLVVFFIQNQDMVQVHFLGLIGPVPLGLALFIAAVAGGVLVAIAGAIRIIQLRAAARRARRGTAR